MANRYFTILIVPEKTSEVKKIVIPSWLARGAAAGLALFTLVGIVMMIDYWYVISQIGENKQLKMENRRLRQQVQIFRNKLTTIESTMERVRTFATRLKVITNIEDRGTLLQSLNGPLPDAATSATASASSTAEPPTTSQQAAPALTGENLIPPSVRDTVEGLGTVVQGITESVRESTDPEEVFLRRESAQLDERFSLLNRDSLYVEQQLQDLYELLGDQRAFLSALPTRKPTIGYFTSGFGIRRSPYGGRVKMHEGLDIANRPGTVIRAPADGLVTFADSKSGYGQTIILDHGYGLETWYAHTRKITVQKGQKVKRGDAIALLGNSGRSTGPHLHYEVRVNGTPVNPLSYILEN